MRVDKREFNQLRTVDITRHFIPHAEGSALISVGNTTVICTASVEESVPSFLAQANQGWVTAEYGMLPRATHTRSQREVRAGRPQGRTLEIQRLIGRSLRSVVDLKKMPGFTVYIDADVIKADGGTRTASITGAFVALYDALDNLRKRKKISENPITEILAATSVGILNDEVILDLAYVEDSKAAVDLNVVMTESSRFVEIQGTAEKDPFDKNQLDQMLNLAEKGIKELIEKQKEALGLK